MKRRSFFQRVIGGFAAAAIAPFLPTSPAAKPLGLVFDPDAFAKVMSDHQAGISIRFLKKWDIEPNIHDTDTLGRSIFVREHWRSVNEAAVKNSAAARRTLRN